ncbi:uncharacterized protein LOC117319633 [Pecten maximus]|uniref:uncharacterized protein LOC117319633 n=1 Tax=Pecten maximus TaxID=6579 RepID=UPI001458B68B|nr:uncharacterized protein LOC117319633 [Pecten maximus]
MAWLSIKPQSIPPTNLSAVYVADGTIMATLNPRDTSRIDGYYLEVCDEGSLNTYSKEYLPLFKYRAVTTIFLFLIPKPSTTYMFTLTTIFSGDESISNGSSKTTVTTASAIYKEKGAQQRLLLPKPPSDKISTINFNRGTLFKYILGEIDGDSITTNGVAVRLTSTHAELTIDSLDTSHAGYYYTKMISGNNVLGGEFLVVTDKPSQPIIIASNQSPFLNSSVTLRCASSSQSKPDNHGLVLTSSWKSNGSFVNQSQLYVNNTSLIINEVRLDSQYTRYTCVTEETGKNYTGLPSEESQEFQLTPRYGPQFIRIEGTEGRSPLIWGDVYGPVVCKTDCNPPCVMEWWRQGASLMSPRGTTDNQLELRDSSLPKTREITYTCKARLPSNAGFIAPTMEKNVTVKVHFKPQVKTVMYLDENDTYQRVRTNEIRLSKNRNLVLSVDVDSNPYPKEIDLHNQKIVKAGVGTDIPGRYRVELGNLQCKDTGTYGVSAANNVTENRGNGNRNVWQFGLQVSCTPQISESANNVFELAGRKDRTIPLNVTVTANPKPTGQWSDGVRTLPVLQENNYTYTVRGDVKVMSVNDYRKYHVYITNGIQGTLTVTFQIYPEDVPEIPVDFNSSEVGSDFIKVTWTSGFNGGSPQMFHVDLMAMGKEWVTEILNVSDDDQGSIMAATLENLTPSTDYTIRINVSNKVGRVSTMISVQTLGLPDIPVDFRASNVGSDYIKVAWTSGFNGGSPQLFQVTVMAICNEWVTDTFNISDEGPGVLMTHTLESMVPSTYYVIRLNVFNKIGTGDSSEISVRTIELSTPKFFTVVIFGIVIVLLLFVIGILVGVVIRLKRNKTDGTARTEVVASNADARNINVVKPRRGGITGEKVEGHAGARTVNISQPSRGAAADCEAIATDEDGYMIMLDIPEDDRGYIPMSKIPKDNDSLNSDDEVYIPMSEIPKGGASNQESLATDDKGHTLVSTTPKAGGASNQESLATDGKGYTVVSKTAKGGAANQGSLTKDDKGYTLLSKTPKDKNPLYDDIAPAKSDEGKSKA